MGGKLGFFLQRRFENQICTREENKYQKKNMETKNGFPTKLLPTPMLKLERMHEQSYNLGWKKLGVTLEIGVNQRMKEKGYRASHLMPWNIEILNSTCVFTKYLPFYSSL